ncbi:MAG: hypothetical protein ABSB96_09105 [Gaiellaceae bacterium]
MKNATLLVVIIAALVLFATACGSSRQTATTQSQPKWVTKEAGLVRKMFVGDPKPASISYHRGKKTLSVTLRFNRTVNCEGCPGGRPPGAQILGRIATITLDARTHRMVSFSLLRR